MASPSGVVRPGPAIKDSGFLLTHDWTQLHMPHGLLDPIETKPVEDSDYETVSFPISSVSQVQACVLGKMIWVEECVKNCPVEYIYRSGRCRLCSLKPLSAVVQVTYKITDIVGEEERVLCKSAKSELYILRDNLNTQNEHVEEGIIAFLKKFGSHVQLGRQSLGKAFVRMVVVEKECNESLLSEIAGEIFRACDEHEDLLTATQEGSWYNPKQFFNTLSWSKDKIELLQNAKLCISHMGVKAKTVSLTEWRNSPGNHPQMLGGKDNSNMVPIWDLISNPLLQFQNSEILSSAIKMAWQVIKRSSKPQGVIIPHDPPTIRLNPKHDDITIPHCPSANSIPDVNPDWCHLAEELGMQKYFPGKLSLQQVRCLHKIPEKCEKKEELVWRVLDQLMLTNPNGREQEIKNYIKYAKQRGQPISQVSTVPHPMDVMLLLFLSSDFMLRQVLARKLFLCRLAIPFIVPISEEKVQLLIWPLRSIVMEWENKEEALVKCKFNLITFIRCGTTTLSKSKLLNELLSSSGHPAFFHNELPCGNKDRLISHGMVEISHFLPDESEQDEFKEPSLFVNLRGSVCDHPIQHNILMNLPTLVVILVDIEEINDPQVEKALKTTLEKKKMDLVIILTNSKNHKEKSIETWEKTFVELVGDQIDVARMNEKDGDGETKKTSAVYMYEEDGTIKNKSEVQEEIKEAITGKKVSRTQGSMESFKEALASSPCVIDEIVNIHCSTGKEKAENLLACMKQIDVCERKEKLLPRQGHCLLEIGKKLRTLHRSKDATVQRKSKTKNEIKTFRQKQSATSKDDQFVSKVISLLHHDDKIKSFAVRWVQLELDAISRDNLPQLQTKKNDTFHDLTTAKSQKKSTEAEKHRVDKAEQKLAAASCGWEHLMREVGQLYEMSNDLDLMDIPVDGFHRYKLPDIAGKQLLDGHPVELMDGDHGLIPIKWVQAVFGSLAQLAGQDKKIFVLSVLGIQSSGKSTLLNTMFGLEFAVSAGRCTRGIYAQLLPVDDREDLQFDYILVIDSEGLKSQELKEKHVEHDNELATLVIGIADLALINIKGETTKELTEVLQIVVHSFLRMKLADFTQKRQCMFIHQNVSAVNTKQKLASDRQNLLEQLDRMTQEASEAQYQSSEMYRSFNQIISFDCDRDVVYFSDLWTGTPPMATVNKDYSMRAAYTRQSIMNRMKDFNGNFITITDFIDRVKDMWKGVLAEDFIFSFRCTLAAKSYIQVEKEEVRLTRLVEQDLMNWLNNDCKTHMEKTKSEVQLDLHHEELIIGLCEKVDSLTTQNLKDLEDFFVKHPAKEIIVQWKKDMCSSFKLHCKKLGQKAETDMDTMKWQIIYRIRQRTEAETHKQEIMKGALDLAKGMRSQGNSLSENNLSTQFDLMWKNWANRLGATSSQTTINAMGDFKHILWTGHDDMIKYLTKQIEKTPLDPAEGMETILTGEIDQTHIKVHEEVGKGKGYDSKFKVLKENIQSLWQTKTNSNCLDAALKKANKILQIVMGEVRVICNQDIKFDSYRGQQIIDRLLREITDHNALPFNEAQYVFTKEFEAMMAIRVARCAAPMFDRMSRQYEEKHGVHAELQAYKQRIFLLFKNTVQSRSAEVTASEDFCEALKGKVMKYVILELEQNVWKVLGTECVVKYELITMMLDEMTQMQNPEENFKALMKYVHKPYDYAESWLKKTYDRKLFIRDSGESQYSQLAMPIIEEIVSEIVSSTSEATKTVSTVLMTQQTDRYSTWITAFCDNVNNKLGLNEDELRLNTHVTSFDSFQNFLEDKLEDLKKEVQRSFSEKNEHTVKWNGKVSPYEKFLKDLWGCTEVCPFCSEPCRFHDPHHTIDHKCVQHRPTAMRGNRDVVSKILMLDTCSFLITGKTLHNCRGCRKHCRLIKHCNRTDEDKDDPIHPYSEYKTIVPHWDISPDETDSASKFWQWAMCTFETQILERYEGTTIDIPDSWRITSKQARDSLRP